MNKVLPSILTADFTEINDYIKKMTNANINELHIDVMDGSFVPAITFGAKYLEDIKKHFPDLLYDVHLMIVHPENHIDEFIHAGATSITIHVEAANVKNIKAISEKVRKLGIRFGISLSPETNPKKLDKLLKKVAIDKILIMSVRPGKGSQPFIEETYDKIKYFVKLREEKGYGYQIDIDGGVNLSNIDKLYEAKTDAVVIGSAIFKDDKIEENTKEFLEIANKYKK